MKDEIRRHIKSYGLVSNFIDIEKQLQPAGLDVTVKKIMTIDKVTPVLFSDAKQVFREHFIEHDFSQPIQRSKPYVFVTNEIFEMPLTLTAYAAPRSSFTRLGATLSSGIIDAGYHGDLSFSVQTELPLYIDKDARFAQLVFFPHGLTQSYSGQYQGSIIDEKRTETVRAEDGLRSYLP